MTKNLNDVIIINSLVNEKNIFNVWQLTMLSNFDNELCGHIERWVKGYDGYVGFPLWNIKT